MLLLMNSKSEGTVFFSKDETSDSVSEQQVGVPSDSVRKCKRKENNRAAAQRSRQKQTERADALHKELQLLEHSNAAYEKEIANLRQEIQQYTSALEQHEPHCCLHAFHPRDFDKFTPAPVSVSAPPPELTHSPGLADLQLDCTDWSFILESI